MGRCPRIEDIELQLATHAKVPFSGRGWIFEIKYDGFRILAERRGAAVKLRYRGGAYATSTFPEIAHALANVDHDVILDGELVVPNGRGRPEFALIQKRFAAKGAAEAGAAANALPATFFA